MFTVQLVLILSHPHKMDRRPISFPPNTCQQTPHMVLMVNKLPPSSLCKTNLARHR